MTAVTMMRRAPLWVWLLVSAVLLLVGVANWHLVHVAMTSQPDCVAHQRLGNSAPGGFSAAQSSCTPR